MKKTNRGFAKQLLAGTLLVGIVASSSLALTQVALAATMKKTTVIPTNYTEISAKKANTTPANPAGSYVKANYTVKYSDRYQANVGAIYPTAEHVSQEQAAEITAQAIWNQFGISMEGKTIETTLFPTHGTASSRPQWFCSVDYGGTMSVYSRAAKGMVNLPEGFQCELDGITGATERVEYTRTLSPKIVSPSSYEAAARELVTKYNLLEGSIESVTYFNPFVQSYDRSAVDRRTYEPEEIGGNVGVKGTNGAVIMLTIAAEDLSPFTATYGIIAEKEYTQAKADAEEIAANLELERNGN